MVSGSLSKKVQEEAALLTSQVWKHRQIHIASEKKVMQSDEEKMNQRRQMPCPKSHSLIQVYIWSQSFSSQVLCSSPLTTVPHATRCTTVMIMTNITRKKLKRKAKGI